MSEQLGKFIAIEGGDGSGKGTQTELLVEQLRSEGRDVKQMTFPQYKTEFAYIAEQYLNKEYGDALKIHADLASLPFAIDRLATAPQIREHLSNPDAVVVTDRYVASNLAHQGTKFDNAEDRHAFYERLKQIEFKLLKLPKPDLNAVLLVPSQVAQANVALKAARSYTTASHDAHEESADHLQHANENYQELCRLFPIEFIALECMRSALEMRSIEEIAFDLRELVRTELHI